MNSDADTLLAALRESEGYCELQMWEAAWNVLEDLPSHLKVTGEVLERRVSILVGAGEMPKALMLAESLSTAIPDSPAVWFRLACVQAAVGDIPGAKTAVERCIELDPVWRIRVLDEPGLEGIW